MQPPLPQPSPPASHRRAPSLPPTSHISPLTPHHPPPYPSQEGTKSPNVFSMCLSETVGAMVRRGTLTPNLNP